MDNKSKINNLYLEGYILIEIANILSLEYEYVKEVIESKLCKELNKAHLIARNNKKKIIKLNRERIKNLYIKGYNYNEISQMLELKYDRVRKFISRNFLLDYKEIHKKNREQEKSIKRAIDNKVNSYITNQNFLKQNRQAYKYNQNMNITFDDSIGVKTDDVPKTFYSKKY